MPITSSPLNSIQKACGILRALSAKSPLRLSEITTAAGLNKVTTLRILDTLVQEGFVRRLDDEASYVLGPEILAMTSPLQQPSDIR
jgi:DNA-binding IclR family transcriptional regulator